jgi:hypothetical protein
MSTNPINLTSPDAIFKRKEDRRRNVAALTVEEKVEMLVQLQQLAWQVASETGRPCSSPWGTQEVSDKQK